MPETILYEQPVNEQVRVFLRLEHLLSQASQTLSSASIRDSRATLATFTDIINVLDRPDLKTKFVKELSRLLANFSRLEQTPNIDQHKLAAVIIELEDLIDNLQTTTGKLCQELRDNEFLASIRQHLQNPGGACGFDLPGYHYWLQLPANVRTANFNSWFNSFKIIQTTVNLLLRLIRQSSTSQIKTATDGFFQTSLDPQAPCQLVQVAIPANVHVYPEISVGRHGIFIRFFELNVHGRSIQTRQSLEFTLKVCIL